MSTYLRSGSISLPTLPPLALYVHYPWCVRKCPYCDFNSHEASPAGAPEDIARLERLDRGWYAGPVGWMDATEDGEFCVALRSALLRDRTAHLFAGAGIVADSDPAAELAETELKLGAMLPLVTA